MQVSRVIRFGLAVVTTLALLGGDAGFGRGARSAAGQELKNGVFDADLNGVNIHYAVHGSGPVVMVLPNSWGLTHSGLRALFQPLEKGFTWIYFDPRGMGGSSPAETDEDLSMATVRADLEALRQYLKLGRTNVLGWSNGGMNLLLFAAEHPESMAKAVIVHATANFTPDDLKRIQAEHPNLTQLFGKHFGEMLHEDLTAEQKNQKQKEFVIEQWFPLLFADPAKGRELLRALYKDTDLSWRHYLYSNQVDGKGFDARPSLPKITCPSLVIAGRHDFAPPERVKEIHDLIPDSEFVVFEKSGHFSPVEEPERFAQVLIAFLKR